MFRKDFNNNTYLRYQTLVEIINKEGVLIMKIYVLEYDFTVYTVNLEAKETKRKSTLYEIYKIQ